jgi:hypothetical protein
MNMMARRLSNNDYTQAGILCEIIFFCFALGGRMMNNNLGVYGALFMLAGLVLIGRGYKGEWTL